MGGPGRRFDLESNADFVRLSEVELAFEPLEGLIVLDEVQRKRDLFTSALVIRQLAPWHENLAEGQVRAPKVYIADSGLLHA